MIPLLARGLAPSAAVASGLVTPVAMGATGDLDPSFGDVGRLAEFGLLGGAWSLEPLEDDGALFAGGYACYGWYCYDDTDASNFVSRVSATGSIDPSYAAAQLENVQIFDVALQPADGKAVAVGRTVINNDREVSALTIVRLERDGALDLTFGEQGIVRSPTTGFRNTAQAVALDPDGGIVVAGIQAGQLIVTRLFANGTVDDSFASSGQFLGPDNRYLERIHILRTAAGNYRITANSWDSCRVVGLTASGELDPSFGDAGLKLVGGPPGSMRCKSMTAQSDGRLLFAGRMSTGAFITRLLPNGEPDPSFTPTVVADLMSDATALAVGTDDSVLVAGRGPSGVSGAVIVRLQADGELDVLFGNAGATWIDLESDWDSWPEIHDIAALPDGSAVAAGEHNFSLPFMVRLVGGAGAGSPGVVDVETSYLPTREDSQQVTVTVRRIGGATGRISVAYQTAPNDWDPATAGVDYADVSGRLTWEDGDMTEQAIVIPIVQDTRSEVSELFWLVLDDVQGGAGLGTRRARVDIEDDEPAVVPSPPPSPSPAAARRGGGALGVLSLMFLGLVRLLRYPRRSLSQGRAA
jgi:uncharacterized delta-60 repeat protein